MSRVATVTWIVVVAVELAALVGAITLWLLARGRAERLERRVAELEGSAVRRARRLVPRPDEAVKAVWDTAALVRDKGIGGAVRSSINDIAGWAEVERPDLVRLAGTDGRVAILFSDIEGSTSLNDKLGDRTWVRLLGVHDRVVRKQVERYDGHVVKTQGDGFMVAFADAEAAVRCSVGVQRALDRGRRMGKAEILVRVGIHYGSVVHRDNDIFGRNVALAARIAAHAEGGQVLLSEPVAAAVTGHDDLVLGEAALVELKGLSGEHELVELAWRESP